MEQIRGVLLDPFAQSVIIVCCHEQHEQVNILDFVFHLFCVLIDDLPPEPEGYQYRYYCYPGERQHYVGHHFAHHRANAILRIVKVM